MSYLDNSAEKVLNACQLCDNGTDKTRSAVAGARSCLQLISELFASQERTHHSTAMCTSTKQLYQYVREIFVRLIRKTRNMN